MSAPQLALEWRADPEPMRGGVVDAALAWCSCGWRYAETCYSRKENERHARIMFEIHRERFCLLASLPPAEMSAARLLTPAAPHRNGDET
jgi:hypothetical protein